MNRAQRLIERVRQGASPAQALNEALSPEGRAMLRDLKGALGTVDTFAEPPGTDPYADKDIATWCKHLRVRSAAEIGHLDAESLSGELSDYDVYADFEQAMIKRSGASGRHRDEWYEGEYKVGRLDGVPVLIGGSQGGSFIMFPEKSKAKFIKSLQAWAESLPVWDEEIGDWVSPG